MASMAALKKDLRKKIKKVLASISDAAAYAQSEYIPFAALMTQKRMISC
jgi:hypothetical protein